MMMAITEYKYQSPLDNGYILIKVSRAQHKLIFRARRIRLWSAPKYFYNGETVIVEHLTARWFLALVFIPILLIGPFLYGIPRTWKDLKRELFQRKYGSFSSDSWRVIPGKHLPEEQPIIDEWLKQS
ncbi:hypothetical protein ACTM40_23685 [Citrobacter freundii]